VYILIFNSDIEEKDIKTITEKISTTIFNDLAKENNEGKVSTDVFFETLANISPHKNCLKNEQIPTLDYIKTTSEQIVERLKKLKERAIFREDKESQDDIIWYDCIVI
jgi:hypothetical protein